MADVIPFPALRYNPARVKMASVVTQPYDKITPAMQERYYAASPHNLVRIILGRREPADNESTSVYTRAADDFRQWRAEGVLQQDAQPAFYAYAQRFSLAGANYERRGFIGLGRLEDYGAGVVFRHEQTLSGPKQDRLELLRQTRAHFGQLFMLYSDSERRIEQRLPTDNPEVAVHDEYGVEHRLWRMTRQEDLDFIREAMREQKLIIADGHHRYETALAYRDERRLQAGRLQADAPYERVMMTFINSEGEGLVILPTHRVVFGLPSYDAKRMVRAAEPYFEVQPVEFALDASRASTLLEAAPAGRSNLLAVTGRGAWLLTAREQAANGLLAGYSERQRRLDVVQLHKVMLEHVLGISEQAIREQRNLRYLRDAGEAIAEVRQAADAAFLMKPVGMAQMREIALAGEVLPQKSTDFYPKLLSGLAIYALE